MQWTDKVPAHMQRFHLRVRQSRDQLHPIQPADDYTQLSDPRGESPGRRLRPHNSLRQSCEALHPVPEHWQQVISSLIPDMVRGWHLRQCRHLNLFSNLRGAKCTRLIHSPRRLSPLSPLPPEGQAFRRVCAGIEANCQQFFNVSTTRNYSSCWIHNR